MAMSDRLVSAFALACRIHCGQQRKGSGVPYITHPMGVAALVGEYGGDEEEIIAALLHDVVEDGGGLNALAEIREQFGERVARIVEACSDAVSKPKPPWLKRKEAFISRIESAPPDVRLVATADKLHNARSTLRDVAAEGDGVWERFSGKRHGTLWYYPAVTEALGAGWSHPVLGALEDAVAELSEFVSKEGG